MSLSLSERSTRVVWHPFTQMKTAPLPIGIVRGEGALLFDEKGNEYLDAVSSWWTNLHGHAHPYIAEQLARQARTLEHVIFANFTHPPAVELAEQLLEILPDNQARIFYSDNGSTAVEVGIKMCLQYWYNLGQPRTRILALHNSYHGDTFGAMSVAERSTFNQAFEPLLFRVTHLMPPYWEPNTAFLQALERELRAGDVAAFIFEPLVQGAGGMLMYDADTLEAALRLCRRYGVLTIADEVMTGFGRTGTYFAVQSARTPPDVMCLSKGLTGGTMALGITTCTAQLFDAFYHDDTTRAFFHGHSFTANPLACTAALASLHLLRQPYTQEAIYRISVRHLKFAKTLQYHPLVRNLRQTGTILALDLHTDHATDYFNPLRQRIWEFVISRRVLLRPLGNTLYLIPPYCITDAQLSTLYQTITDLLQHLSTSDR